MRSYIIKEVIPDGGDGDVGSCGVWCLSWHCGLNPCDPAVGNAHSWESVEVKVSSDAAILFSFV